MDAKELKKGVYWVGGIDWDLRNFHGYLTQRGSTYNAYLIVDEKIVLIDSAKHYLASELLERISSVVDVADIDYIVQNHVEMDHSGALPQVVALAPKAKVVTNQKAKDGLEAHFGGDWDYMIVKTGDELSLGKRTLKFVQTPMVHWPDNMVTYCPEEKILFSNDAFGQHISSSERLDNEYPLSVILEEAKKYYANIVLPYGMQVQKALQTVDGLDIDFICPSHGIIWHEHIEQIVSLYKQWSANETKEKALVIYDTMWGSTKTMAEVLMDVFEGENISAELVNLQHTHISDVMTKLVDSKYICVGSPTLNNNILPTVASFLCYLSGLAPKKRIGLAFGSYGWGGQSVGIVNKILQDAGFEMMNSYRLQYVPKEELLEEMRNDFMRELAEKQ